MSNLQTNVEKMQLPAMSVFLAEESTQNFLQQTLKDRTNQFIVSLCSVVSNSEKLQKCTRNTLMSAAMKATALDLPIDQNLGFAYIIPYENRSQGITEAQLQIGVGGYKQLAMRTGQVKRLNTMTVKEGEFHGRDEFGEPIILWQSEDVRNGKKIAGFMAALELINGFKKVIYWDIDKMNKHKERYSKSYQYAENGKYGKKDSLWHTDFEVMAHKTVLKNLIKNYCPISIEMQTAMFADNSVISYDIESGTEIIEPTVIDFDSDNSEKITAKQKQEIAKLVGIDGKKQAILAEFGFSIETLDEVPLSQFESIIEALKV